MAKRISRRKTKTTSRQSSKKSSKRTSKRGSKRKRNPIAYRHLEGDVKKLLDQGYRFDRDTHGFYFITPRGDRSISYKTPSGAIDVAKTFEKLGRHERTEKYLESIPSYTVPWHRIKEHEYRERLARQS